MTMLSQCTTYKLIALCGFVLASYGIYGFAPSQFSDDIIRKIKSLMVEGAKGQEEAET